MNKRKLKIVLTSLLCCCLMLMANNAYAAVTLGNDLIQSDGELQVTTSIFTLHGDLEFADDSARIMIQSSAAPPSSQAHFISSIEDQPTYVNTVPNGSSNASGFIAYGDENMNTGKTIILGINDTTANLTLGAGFGGGLVPDFTFNAGGSTVYTINGTSRAIDLNGSLFQMQGSSVASAATTNLGAGNLFHITGTTTITTLNTCDATNNGRAVTLIFDSTANMTDGSNLKLNIDFNGSPDDTISLICDGISWFETSRSGN